MSKSTIEEICSNEYECDHNEYDCATLELADRFQQAWRSLSWLAFTGDRLTTSKNIVKSVIGFNFS
uniref:Uncharacterized protein n=1 Tax=viral metagenome TaxID=1070528 RepID=A0A6C0I0W9_9ZZZZ